MPQALTDHEGMIMFGPEKKTVFMRMFVEERLIFNKTVSDKQIKKKKKTAFCQDI